MADIPPELSGAPAWVTGLGLGGAVLYQVWRKVRGDFRKDAVDEAADKFRADLVAQVHELQKRVDEAIHQRNQLVASEARLTSEVASLKDQVAELRKDKEEMRRRLDEVTAFNLTLIRENADYKARILVLEGEEDRR